MIPESSGKKGRKPATLKAQEKPIRVDKWVKNQPDSAWSRCSLRDSTKGELLVDILCRMVWLWDGEEKDAKQWHLVARREVNAPAEFKYSLCNMPEGTPSERLAYMQANGIG